MFYAEKKFNCLALVSQTTFIYASVGSTSANHEQHKKIAVDRPEGEDQRYEYSNPQAADMELYETPDDQIIYENVGYDRRQ